MKFSLAIFILSSLVVISCNKDKFQTRPTITLKSINNEVVPQNGSLVVELEVTDKEGDVQDSVIVIKKRLNKRVVTTVRDTLRFKYPVFPETPKTQVLVTLDYQSILSALNPPTIPGSMPPQRELDTLQVKFAVKDNAGNVSDTLTIPTIYVVRF